MFFVACVALALTGPDAHATLSVTAPNGATRTIDANGDIMPAPGMPPNDDPFFQQVQDCLNELKALGKIGTVTTLVNSANAHSIEKEPNTCKGSTCSAGADANRAADGTPGAGTGSTTKWQPTNTKAFPNGQYSDGTPRDPCGALLHELVHAVDADMGWWSCDKMDTNDAGTQSVLVDEVRACQAQNWFHQAKGIASRTQYGGQDLPAGVVFDKCPTCVTLDIPGFGITAIDLVWEVPVTGTGKAMNSDVPGVPIPVGPGDGTIVLRKNLDGTVTICMDCGTGGPLTLNSVHWTYGPGGQTLTPMPDDFGGMPLTCDAITGIGKSMPLPLPTVPSIRVSKYPEEQMVDENGNLTFTIKVTNTSDQPLMNVMVTDIPFGGASFNIGNLAPGETHCEDIMVNVGMGTGRRVNKAQAQGQNANGIQTQGCDYAHFTVN